MQQILIVIVMKKYLLDVLKALCLWVACGLITQLFNMFFGWMMLSWPHWLIVVFSVILGFTFLGVGTASGVIAGVLNIKTIVGVILSSIASIGSLVIAIKNLWLIPSYNNMDIDGWLLYVCIYGSVFYLIMFGYLIGMLIIFYIDSTKKEINN